jgi:hypothetical protein
MMQRLRLRLAIAGITLSLCGLLTLEDAQAERLIVSVSKNRVTVTPNYYREEQVLFG